MRRFLALVGLCVLALGLVAGRAQAGQLVVIDSSTPGLEPGQVVQSDTFLDVPDGYSVTLVAESGRTVTVSGPHAGAIPGVGEGGGQASKLVSSLSALLKGGGRETAALGAIRSIGPKEPPNDPWVIDTGSAGVHCVAASGPVKLWRSGGGKAGVLTLKNLNDRTRASANWPAGAEVLEWPADVTRLDGAQYLVGFKNSRVRKKIRLRLLPAGLPTDAHKAAWMADNGCTHQAHRLLAKIR